tara:strand:+ start:144 stop:941 length:798 start_codon:yes stop_codon:yes gene_type:complete
MAERNRDLTRKKSALLPRRGLAALVLAVGLSAALLTGGASSAFAAGNKIVVELFTSQGCSSCPPADRLVGELAKRDDVLPLSFHVDYWDYLGWKDPFSSAEYTLRQRDYRGQFGLRYIYTPQIVIGGTKQEVGSHRGKVLRAIEQVRARPMVAVSVAHPDEKTALVAVDAGRTPGRTATVWLFAYDKSHTTEIQRGENGGVTLTNSNVVRAIRPIGKWDGKKTEIEVPIAMLGIDKQDGCAIVVQEGGNGAILGAADFPLMKKGS